MRRRFNRLQLACLAPLLVCCAAVAQSAGRPAPQIDYIYFGGDDCPPCRVWRAQELPKLKAMPEFKDIRFSYVTKEIRQPIPPADAFPPDIRYLHDTVFAASAGQIGSSQNVFLVNGKVVDYWHGSRSAQDIRRMIQAIEAGQKLPGKPCIRLWENTYGLCKVFG